MARILPDREIEKLLGKVIKNGIKDSIKPSTYIVRVGTEVRYPATNELFKDIKPDNLIEIKPREFVEILSLEEFDLRKETVEEIFPGKRLHAIVVASASLTRRGLSQVATKLDTGYEGRLSWGATNYSSNSIRLKHGERLYHLNFFLLEKDEVFNEIPDKEYGERESDTMQGFRSLSDSPPAEPSVMDKKSLIKSSLDEIDNIKQLKAAGPPFSTLGNEVESLREDFSEAKEIISSIKNGMSSNRDEHVKFGNEIGKFKIEVKDLIEKVKKSLSKQMIAGFGIAIGALSILLAITRYNSDVPTQSNILLLFGCGIILLLGVYLALVKTIDKSNKQK